MVSVPYECEKSLYFPFLKILTGCSDNRFVKFDDEGRIGVVSSPVTLRADNYAFQL